MITKKVCLIGMWGVGKTSLVKQFVHSMYEDKYHSTLGVKVDKKVLRVADSEVKLMLWDIAGAEDDFSIPMHYLKGSTGYMLVIDGTRAETLTSAVELANRISAEMGDIPFVVMVNKSDLEWEISEAQINAALGKFGQVWFSGSAKTGENVELAFHTLAENLL
ncbi:MAG: small GTP-binding protein [Candidatus Azotimanducaceae bacterium]|jgi:small GTP-binding protein